MESNADTERKPGRGGHRENAGRKPNSMNAMSRAAREAAAKEGLLPHEILLRTARGFPVTVYEYDETGENLVPKKKAVSADQVMDAARAAAPYYAPKLSTVETMGAIADDDLDAIIEAASAEAGISVSFGGEGEAGVDEEGAGEKVPRRVRHRL